MNAYPRQGIPLRPDPAALERGERRSIRRAVVAVALSALRSESAEAIVGQEWPNDTSALMYTKAAVSPTSTSASALTPTRIGSALLGLAPESAAARLFAQCVQLDFNGVYQFKIPYPSLVPVPIFIAEGAPMPMVDATLATATVGPVRKILLGAAATGELVEYSAENAAIVIGRILSNQVARSLDAAVFGTAAADATRPGGLLNGVTPIAATAGGGLNALVNDIANIGGAIAMAGGNADNLVIVASPEQAVALRLLAGPGFTSPVFSTTALASGTVVGVDPNAIATGYGGLPSVETSVEGTAHFENTTPLAISTPGTPNVVSAPVRAAWQTYTQLIKVRLNAAWASLGPGMVQTVTGTTW